MITIEQYFMGRDRSHAAELTDELRHNAQNTVGLVNAMLEEARADGIEPGIDAATHNNVASGWRPAGINAATANAAATSTHLTCQACDLRDTQDRQLARWCLRNLDVLARLGLWMEDPRWTPSWVHVQIRPPHSGHRVYVPSTAPPSASPLPEQGG